MRLREPMRVRTKIRYPTIVDFIEIRCACWKLIIMIIINNYVYSKI